MTKPIAMLNRVVACILAAVLALQCEMVPAGKVEAQQAKKEYTIAVLRLDTKQISEAQGEVITSRLMSTIFQLINSDRYRSSGKTSYTMVERNDMDKIFDQFKVQFSGCVSDSCAIEFGKMLSADRIIFGSVSYVGNSYSLSLKIVDVLTSRAIAIADVRYSGSFDRLLERGVNEIVEQLFIGRKKKSNMKWYFLIGAVIAGAGAGAALIGGSGGGTSGPEPLPLPPDMP